MKLNNAKRKVISAKILSGKNNKPGNHTYFYLASCVNKFQGIFLIIELQTGGERCSIGK